jgi:hypothetical protein
MGTLNFNDGPPYNRLDVQSAEAKPTSDGVEVVLNIFVDGGQPTATVPVLILMDPGVARALAGQIEPAAATAERWLEGRS